MTIAKHASKNQLVLALEVAVLLAAFGVRLAYFDGLSQIFPDFLVNTPFCGLDANAYHEVYARGILKGTWPGDEPFFHMILYPFFLSGIYALVGVSLRVVVVAHILLDVVTCAAIFGVGRLTFNRQTGLLASLFFAFYGPLIFFNPCFAQVALSIPLFTLALFFLLKFQASSNHVHLIIASVITGFAALSRPTFFLMIPIVFLWWLISRVPLRRAAGQATVFLVIIFLITLPASIHNSRTGGYILPTPVSGWEIFFLGNNPFAEGMGWVDYVLYNHFDVMGEQYASQVRQKANQTSSAVYREEAVRYIINNPTGWLSLLQRKAYLLLGERDSYLISPYFVHNLQTVPLLRYFPLGWRSVLIGALLGMVLVKQKYRSLFLLILSALVLFTLLFHIQYRFRLLFIPLILLYVAALIVAAPRLKAGPFWISLVVLAIGTLFLPELGWILVLFVATAVWPFVKRKNWPVVRWTALAAWGYLVVALLSAHIISFVTQSEQRQAIFLGPSIAGPVALGQSFVVHCDGFNRVSLNLGRGANLPRETAVFHLRSGQDGDDIYATSFDLANIADRTWQDFTFPSQRGSAGRRYFFFVEAPQANLNETITLRGTYDRPFDRYREGLAYLGQRGSQWHEIPGDLAFKARCEAGLLELINQGFDQLVADNAFGLPHFYWAIWLSHLGLLATALIMLQKLTNLSNLISLNAGQK